MAYEGPHPLPIPSGGTNTASFANTNGTVYYDGTSLSSVATGISGQVLTSNGASAPSFQPAAASGITTLLGDSGSTTATTVTLSGALGGGSVTMVASASQVLLSTSDARQNTFIGRNCGNTTNFG